MAEIIDRKKLTIDATDQVLGRLATQVAGLLRGKHKPGFSYHIDNGDFVEITNINKMRVTGNKMQQKIYYRHSGWIGNLRAKPMEKLFEKNPSRILELAVSRMLAKNKLRAKMLARLTIKGGEEKNK